VSDDIAKSTAAIGSFDDVAKLVGDNADDVAKLGAKELAALGIADAKSIGRFLRYRDLLKQNAALQRSLDAAKVTQMLERAGPGLSKVQSMGEKLSKLRAAGKTAQAEKVLEKMRRVVDKANYRAGNAAGDVGHLIHNADGYMLAVGKSGKVELLAEAADLSRWIDETASFQGINPDVLRAKVAEKILGRTLDGAHAQAIAQAHAVEGFGTLEEGGITRGNLRDKVDAMKKLFTKDERRLLMERGVTGTSTKNAPPELTPLDDVGVLDDADVLDDVDAAGSSVKMSSDATIVEDRFTRLDPDMLQKGKKYSLSKDGRGWEFDSVDPATDRLIFKRGDEVKTFNPKKLKVDGALKTPSAAPESAVRSAPRKGARATWKKVYDRYAAEQGSNPVASAIGASFEPEFWEAGLKSAYMRGTDALSKVPSATRTSVSSVRSFFTRTRARPTVSRTAADPLAVESFRTKKPALGDRYAFALESREGNWIGKRAGAALDVARGKDFLKQRFRAFEKGRKELLSVRKQMQAIEAKLQKNPMAARARQLREKLSTLSERREALRKDVRAARMDVRPEYVKSTVPIKSLPDAERIPLVDAAAQRLTETYTFGGKDYVFFGIDGKTGLAIFTDASDEAYRVTFTKKQLQAIAAKSPEIDRLMANIQLRRTTLSPGQRTALERRAQLKTAYPVPDNAQATPATSPSSTPAAPTSASTPSPKAAPAVMPRAQVSPSTSKTNAAPSVRPTTSPAVSRAPNTTVRTSPIDREIERVTLSMTDEKFKFVGPR
jgi:hypothetical protein